MAKVEPFRMTTEVGRNIRNFAGITTANDSVYDSALDAWDDRVETGTTVFTILKLNDPKKDWPQSSLPRLYRLIEAAKLSRLEIGLGPYFPLLHNVLVDFETEHFINRWQTITTTWQGPFGDLNWSNDKLYFQLLPELEVEPVEDGIPHAIEKILQHVVINFPENAADSIFASFERMVDEGRFAAAAGLLQCIGRINSDVLKENLADIVSRGLSDTNPELREAAISVVEQVADPSLKELLSKHTDSIAWLNRYAAQVLADLSD
jgi:hypothetical protein